MQVSVETTSELMRKLTVQVPEEKIQSEISKRLQTLAQKVRLDGFRPGKVPGSVVKKRFSGPVRQEVLTDLIQSSLYDALHDNKLHPAGVPEIEKKNLDKGLEFEATFEIYPQFELCSFSDLKITRPGCEVTDADIDSTIEKLREQKKQWTSVERAAQDGDQLTIIFSGSVNGENFTDGTVNDFKVTLGSSRMIPGFEDQLVNMEVGDNKTFTADFPADYGNEKLAGNVAEFSVKVNNIEESSPAVVDAEFVKAFGVESGEVSELRDALKSNMEVEVGNTIRAKAKEAVMEELLNRNNLTLPQVMVDQEIERMRKSAGSEGGAKPGVLGESDRPDVIEQGARRRVTLGLLMAEIIKTHNLSADPDKVRKAITELSQSYQAPEEVVNWYYSNDEQLRNVENMVLEEQVVDVVLAAATINEEKADFESLVNPG